MVFQLLKVTTVTKRKYGPGILLAIIRQWEGGNRLFLFIQDHERQARVFGTEFKRPLGLAHHAMGNVSPGRLEAQDWNTIRGAECALIQSACFLVAE